MKAKISGIYTITNKVNSKVYIGLSKDLRDKLGKSHIGKSPLIKPIIQYDMNGNFIKHWNSRNEIEKALNKRTTHISQCCNGKRNSAFGYKWQFAKNEQK